MQAPVRRLPPQSSKTPPAARHSPISKRSAPAPLEGLTFQRERLGKLLSDRELLPLIRQHYEETDPDAKRVPVDVNWDYYLAADRCANLVVFTARDGVALVGYVFTIVGPHHHKQEALVGSITMYWLHPANRVGLAGYKLLRANEALLKDIGVQKVLATQMLGRRTDLLFKRMGYTAEEVLYGKWL